MKKLLILVIALTLSSLPVLAHDVEKEDEKDWEASGNIYFGPAVLTDRSGAVSCSHIGGGMDAYSKSHKIGFTLDGGFYFGGDMESISLSPGLSFFFPGEGKAVPFVKAGMTFLIAGESNPKLGFLGGGIDYWVGERLGLRFEVRDQFWLESFDTHLVDFRAALVIRGK